MNDNKNEPQPFAELTDEKLAQAGYETVEECVGKWARSRSKKMIEGLRTYGLQFPNLYLTKLPPKMALLQETRKVVLTKNRFETIPDEICQLVNLEELRIDDNRISSLPAALVNLRALKKLDLDKNKLEQLPDVICQMVNLEELRIDDNGISSLPASLAKLRALKKLYLCKNKLKQLPAEIGKMGKLECLFADENELEAIPEEIGTLKGLEWLDLMGNRLRELPEALGKLKKLQSLELGNNQFKRIPDPVLALKGLNFLGVGGNPLDTLPDLRGLKKLEELDISDTKLDPGEVAGLVGPEVEIIKIPGNFEADLPPMARRMGWAMCGDWFLSNPDADPEEYPQLIKTLREKWKPRPIVES